MSPFSAKWNESTLDLAVEAFTTGIDPDGRQLLEQSTERDDRDEFEQLLAAINLAGLDDIEAPPADLMSKLTADALRVAGGSTEVPDAMPTATPAAEPTPTASTAPAFAPTPPPTPEPASSGAGVLVTVTGWLAAAAAIAFVLLQGTDAGRGVALGTPGATRGEIIARADAVRLEWAAGPDALSEGVTGEVVWSSELQQGYMVFRGLAPNDPAVEQYQLWVFDTSRDEWEAKPVDGGVFDVGSSGEVEIPIDAKLAVATPGLFAVTVEKPGGVVVSKRERIVVTAQP